MKTLIFSLLLLASTQSNACITIIVNNVREQSIECKPIDYFEFDKTLRIGTTEYTLIGPQKANYFNVETVLIFDAIEKPIFKNSFE